MLKVFLIACLSVAQIIALEETEVNGLMDDWERLMKAFVPDFMISFTIEPGQEEVLVETIQEQTNVRGAYFIPLYSKDTLDFQVMDPAGFVIFTRVHKRESVFSLNVTMTGDYKFVFKNTRSKDSKAITFALDIKGSMNDIISKDDIDPLESQVQTLYQTVQEVYFENKIGAKRFDVGYESMKQANHRVMVLTFFETLLILGVTAWQVIYIKRLFDSKRLV